MWHNCFRVEAAVLEDVINLMCTMRLCQLNIPAQKKSAKQPGKLSNFLLNIYIYRYDKKMHSVL